MLDCMSGARAKTFIASAALLALVRCATSSDVQGDAAADATPTKDAGDASIIDAPADVGSSGDAASDVSGDVIDEAANDASDAAPIHLLVFTTSQTYTGALGGLSGADTTCQSLATQANLPGTYKAWLSDATGTPVTRFTHSTVPYTLVDGTTVVANDWSGLISGTLLHAIDKSESGGAPGKDNSGLSLPTGVTLVWTSTKYDGTLVPNTTCANWTSSSSSNPSEWGRDDATDVNWSQWASSGSCGWLAPLMCFQQ